MTEFQNKLRELNKRYIVTSRFGVVELTKGDDDLYRDSEGTVFALRKEDGALDPVDQCGIDPFVVPDNIFSEHIYVACRVHDYMYESPAYQLFYTRLEADEYLERLISKEKGILYKILGRSFRFLSRVFGARAWEEKTTRDR